jgi:hypothetical protein
MNGYQHIRQNRNCSQKMRSETTKTLKNSAGKNENFLKNGQDLRSRKSRKINNIVCDKDTDVKLNKDEEIY